MLTDFLAGPKGQRPPSQPPTPGSPSDSTDSTGDSPGPTSELSMTIATKVPVIAIKLSSYYL